MRNITCAIVTTLLTILALAGCSSAEHYSPLTQTATGKVQPAPKLAEVAEIEDAEPTADALLTDHFGNSRWGFVEISSANGRLVVLRRFHGPDKPVFGQHGESSDQPQLTVFDRFSGEQHDLTEIIDIDFARRWLVAISQNQLWLIDAENGKWEALAGADMDSDGNACLPPRQASFSAMGRKLAWIVDGGRSITVRELSTARKWSVSARGRVCGEHGRTTKDAESPWLIWILRSRGSQYRTLHVPVSGADGSPCLWASMVGAVRPGSLSTWPRTAPAAKACPLIEKVPGMARQNPDVS